VFTLIEGASGHLLNTAEHPVSAQSAHCTLARTDASGLRMSLVALAAVGQQTRSNRLRRKPSSGCPWPPAFALRVCVTSGSQTPVTFG